MLNIKAQRSLRYQMPLEVILNGTYGWFSFSEQAKHAYREAGGSFDKASDIQRHDALMVSIVKRMGRAAHWKGSEIRIAVIPDRFATHYRISEEDGMETVIIEHDSYRVEAVRAILNDEKRTDSERIVCAKAVLDERLVSCWRFYAGQESS